ncbi:hypothetical protein LINPERPRIM_LOCUS15262 [Linum perenne]
MGCGSEEAERSNRLKYCSLPPVFARRKLFPINIRLLSWCSKSCSLGVGTLPSNTLTAKLTVGLTTWRTLVIV